MKALILAAGKGTRLRPLTYSCPKHLIPVANKPVLFYGLDQIRDAGITEIGIVVSPETNSQIMAAVSGNNTWGFDITYIPQNTPLGLAHAVKVARSFLNDSPFLLFLGDNILQDGVKVLIEQFCSGTSDAVIALKEVDNPKQFGVAEIDGRGLIRKVVEKPQMPKSKLAIVGAYVFSPDIHESIEQLKPSTRGEYEITDAIQNYVDRGRRVYGYNLPGWWLDTGKKEDLLEANRVTLQMYSRRNIQVPLSGENRILNDVEICEKTIIKNSSIYGPVTIAADCRISGSTIGPFTSIGPNTTIVNSLIVNSIIMDNSCILNIRRLTASIMGSNTKIAGREPTMGNVELFLGTDAIIKI